MTAPLDTTCHLDSPNQDRDCPEYVDSTHPHAEDTIAVAVDTVVVPTTTWDCYGCLTPVVSSETTTTIGSVAAAPYLPETGVGTDILVGGFWFALIGVGLLALRRK